MEHLIRIGPGIELWADESGDAASTPLLLVMGANASALTWPDPLAARLAEQHRVIRYDHRDTGRSSSVYDQHPYAIKDLATDAIALLDALGIARAHIVGMSLGGTLTQLMLVDHPDRVLSATLFCTSAIAPVPDADGAELPGPDPRLLALWDTMGEERDEDAEMKWQLDHWRLLNGDTLPFDEDEFRALEVRGNEHRGDWRSSSAHALADQSGLDRTAADLAGVAVPTLVIDAPADPIYPPPHAAVTAAAIGGARLAVVAGMGHALNSAILEPLATLILEHTAAVDGGTP